MGLASPKQLLLLLCAAYSAVVKQAGVVRGANVCSHKQILALINRQIEADLGVFLQVCCEEGDMVAACRDYTGLL